MGTNEDWLIEILCARTKDEIEKINAAYKQRTATLNNDHINNIILQNQHRLNVIT